MIANENLAAVQAEFAGWLAGSFQCKVGGYHVAMYRVPKSADFDYLYCQRSYHAKEIERGSKFEYAGIYCKRDGLVYDGEYCIREFVPDYADRSAEALKEKLKADVRRSVEATIGHNRDNLSITEVTDESVLYRLEHNHKYAAHDKARKMYLSGDYDEYENFTLPFDCDYSPERWTDDTLLAYILNPAQYVETEAAAYIEANQDDMLADFLYTDAVMEAYNDILFNPQYPVHKVKRIMAAVRATSAQAVPVTVCKEGKTLTFKAEASQFRADCTSTYSDWNIKASDRKEYERIFGRHNSYTPDDITLIEYSRSVLYRAE
jgi:hypothetical protein